MEVDEQLTEGLYDPVEDEKKETPNVNEMKEISENQHDSTNNLDAEDQKSTVDNDEKGETHGKMEEDDLSSDSDYSDEPVSKISFPKDSLKLNLSSIPKSYESDEDGDTANNYNSNEKKDGMERRDDIEQGTPKTIQKIPLLNIPKKEVIPKEAIEEEYDEEENKEENDVNREYNGLNKKNETSENEFQEDAYVLKRNELFVMTSKQLYFSGEAISGHIELHIVKPTVSERLSIQLSGLEKVCFTGRSSERNNFLNKFKVLRLPSQNDDNLNNGIYTVVPKGIHRIPFEFQLPTFLPCSFSYEGQNTKASVEYRIVSKLEPPMDGTSSITNSDKIFCELDSFCELNIGGSIYDKTLYNTIKLSPHSSSTGKNIMNFDNTKGRVECMFSISKNCFKPGDIISLHSDIKNLSKERISQTTAKLIAQIDLYSMNKVIHTIKEPISVISVGSVQHSQESHQDKSLVIPEGTVENIQKRGNIGTSAFGRLVQINYFVEVNIEMMMKNVVSVNIPIFISKKNIDHLIHMNAISMRDSIRSMSDEMEDERENQHLSPKDMYHIRNYSSPVSPRPNGNTLRLNSPIKFSLKKDNRKTSPHAGSYTSPEKVHRKGRKFSPAKENLHSTPKRLIGSTQPTNQANEVFGYGSVEPFNPRTHMKQRSSPNQASNHTSPLRKFNNDTTPFNNSVLESPSQMNLPLKRTNILNSQFNSPQQKEFLNKLNSSQGPMELSQLEDRINNELNTITTPFKKKKRSLTEIKDTLRATREKLQYFNNVFNDVEEYEADTVVGQTKDNSIASNKTFTPNRVSANPNESITQSPPRKIVYPSGRKESPSKKMTPQKNNSNHSQLLSPRYERSPNKSMSSPSLSQNRPRMRGVSPVTPFGYTSRPMDLESDFSPIKNGISTHYYPNGSKFTGNFQNAMKHGRGKLVYNDQSVYTGEFFHDKRHGWGVYTTRSYTYDGQWYNGVKQGKGLIVYSNGEKYEGDWEDNLPHGKGEYIFADGSRYSGDFWNGTRNGRGLLYYADGCTVYNGEWNNDKKHGKATITFINGCYEGEMREDLKDGIGTYKYKNGDVYEGGWKENKKHGVGVYKFYEGRAIFKGFWKEGKKHGNGALETSNGKSYIEYWRNGKLIKKVLNTQE